MADAGLLEDPAQVFRATDDRLGEPLVEAVHEADRHQAELGIERQRLRHVDTDRSGAHDERVLEVITPGPHQVGQLERDQPAQEDAEHRHGDELAEQVHRQAVEPRPHAHDGHRGDQRRQRQPADERAEVLARPGNDATAAVRRQQQQHGHRRVEQDDLLVRTTHVEHEERDDEEDHRVEQHRTGEEQVADRSARLLVRQSRQRRRRFGGVSGYRWRRWVRHHRK